MYFKATVIKWEGPVGDGNLRPSEEIRMARLDGVWHYVDSLAQTTDQFRTSAAIKAEVVFANANHSAYQITVSPSITGRILAAEKAVLEGIGTA